MNTWVSIAEGGYPSQHNVWCWVWDGENVFMAFYEGYSHQHWTNVDVWEDSIYHITHWQQIVMPQPPAVMA